MSHPNSFGSAATLRVGGSDYRIHRLDALEKAGVASLSRLPFSIRVLLENTLRMEDGVTVRPDDIKFVAGFNGKPEPHEISFMPARVLLQDFTGVPCVVDLAVMREALQKMGADPKRANPLIPADLVIDHSVQVDYFGTQDALSMNGILEFQRNAERYSFLRWGQGSFQNFRVVPPSTGIVHQVNLEYLAHVVFTKKTASGLEAYPDTLVGTDSHTTMINGLGVVGWGVGGIEAEACMLGQPVSMLLPEVTGFKLHGKLAPGATATDLVLTVTQMLRKKGVVGRFVEFYGQGLSSLALADRATIGNMAPEYGATIGFFPVDHLTLDYLRLTNRPEALVALVEAYAKEQGLFRTDATPDPVFTDTIELDLSTVVPSLAGPKRPQDRINLPDMKSSFLSSLGAEPKSTTAKNGVEVPLRDGSVVIAAITSCTNTSNPSVMVAAGILARKAVERGLSTQPWVKSSLAPGSKVVTDYLADSGLLPYLEQLKFNVVGYGCTTCIGNSGPLPEHIGVAVESAGLNVASVLSGNRNFEGRINQMVRSNYLASPPLVVAYAIAGRVDIDLVNEPIGRDGAGREVFLKEIWPSQEEVAAVQAKSVRREMFEKEYAEVFAGDRQWNAVKFPTGDLYQWDAKSTYIARPPYFDDMRDPKAPIEDLKDLKPLALLGDSITTDHISPAGAIKKETPAGRYLMERGVMPGDFNSYGSRRGNHEVMVRGTLANIRLKNQMAPGVEGGYTRTGPEAETEFIYDVAMRNVAAGVGMVIVAGKEYGSGSSRDWAAKGVALLGVKAVIAESFERIHRSNLVGMGVLPLEFTGGQNRESLGLTGFETFSITELAGAIASGGNIVKVTAADARGVKEFQARVRIDTPREVEYFRNGGILPYVLRQVAG
ncbi:MAG: aconitate hydratase AcnA [Bryobacterales bacterium]|nr:aconitate hydratase AcnA [Bryobacterales bacterium]